MCPVRLCFFFKWLLLCFLCNFLRPQTIAYKSGELAIIKSSRGLPCTHLQKIQTISGSLSPHKVSLSSLGKVIHRDGMIDLQKSRKWTQHLELLWVHSTSLLELMAMMLLSSFETSSYKDHNSNPHIQGPFGDSNHLRLVSE